ncbi:MAG: RsmB/NOP family class I SAM-dependent RNA methyltransferase [Pseudorhodoplanes sp.]
MPSPSRSGSPLRHADVPGLAVRRLAAELVENVLHKKRPLDESLDAKLASSSCDERDRALARQITGTVLRRLGSLRHVLLTFLQRGFPKDAPRVETALLVGAAQILFLDVPDHAAVDLSVRLAQADRRGQRHAGLVNAVLRRTAREGRALLEQADTLMLDMPGWLLARWTKFYGAQQARAIAAASRNEAALDLTVKNDPQGWAGKLSGEVMPTGTVRLIPHGPVAALPGFGEGAWWVQDAAAALPARLFGDVRGRSVADLCAAPGGKTAQLALAGAHVTAIDRAPGRMTRLRENLSRLGLHATAITADAGTWQGGPFDAILLDAPCSSTGTIRRHPDIAWLKQESDLAGLTALQARLLDHAAGMLKDGGTLVYCTCSLEPEEGEEIVASFLQRRPDFRRKPIRRDESPGIADFVTPAGDLRTLPSFWAQTESRRSGLDGFYAARLEKT